MKLLTFKRFFLCLFLMASLSNGFSAITKVTVRVSDILNASPKDPALPPGSIFDQYLTKILQEEFNRLGLDTSNGLVFDDFSIAQVSNQFISVCPVPLPYYIETNSTIGSITLDDNSEFSIDLDGLKNITVAINLSGQAFAQATGFVRYGLGLNCGTKTSQPSGTVTFSLPFNLALKVDIKLDPSFDSEQIALIVNKEATVSGNINFGKGAIGADFGTVTDALVNAFEGTLLNLMKDAGTASFNNKIVTINNQLNGLDNNGNPDPSGDAFNGQTIFSFDLEDVDSELTQLIVRDFAIPEILLELLDARGAEILLQLAVLDEAQRELFLAELGGGVSCQAIRNKFELNLEQIPLYNLVGGRCIVGTAGATDQGQYFTDVACTQQIAFKPTSIEEFCKTRFSTQSKSLLGNAASWLPDSTQINDAIPTVASRKWTSIPSTRMGLGVVSIEKNHQPYVKQINYKTVAGDRGTCQLELRVYKKDIAAQNLQPMLALHGGTWTSRGFSFFGLESTVSLFTEQNFIVFAPFYRLVGASDGNTQCQGASWREVVADVEDALQWVIENGPALGAKPDRVTLFGQSAGGHLAAWLVTHRSENIRNALLFYAPTDMLEFLQGAVAVGGRYADFRRFGLRSMANLYGSSQGNVEIQLQNIDFTTIDINNPPGSMEDFIPDNVFNLAQIDSTNAPAYLNRCANITGLDLSIVNLSVPPVALLSCLKQDLSDFLIENSYNHQVNGETAPLYIVHGDNDTLVPFNQALNLCSAINGVVIPDTTASEDHAVIDCLANSQAHIIKGAEHALDLGICVGELCPAGKIGSNSRTAAYEALTSAYQWVALDQSAPNQTGSNVEAELNKKSGGGGAFSFVGILCLLMFVFIKRRFIFQGLS